MIKAFFKDSIVYSVPKFFSRGISFFLLPLYTRVLSPEDYGSLDLFSVFMSIINLTIALEIYQAIARKYSELKESSNKVLLASTGLWFSIVIYTVVSIGLYLFSPKISSFVFGQSDLIFEFKIGIFIIWLYGSYNIIYNQFRWELRSKNFAIMSLINTIITSLVTVWVAYFLNYGLTGIFVGMASGLLFSLIYGIYNLRNTFKFCFSYKYLKSMLIFSIPLVPSSVSVFASNYTDRLMISSLLTTEDVGLYGIGFRISTIITLIISSFSSALTPLIYRNFLKEETPFQISKLFNYFILFAIISFCIITLFAKDIISLISTPIFYEGHTVVIYLVPAIFLSSMYIFTPGMFIKNKTKFIMIINIIGAVFNILFNAYLIPKYGIVGAATATLCSSLIIYTLNLKISQKLYYVPFKWGHIMILLLITVPTVIFSYFCNHYFIDNIIYKIVTCIILITISIIIMVSKEDINKLIILYRRTAT